MSLYEDIPQEVIDKVRPDVTGEKIATPGNYLKAFLALRCPKLDFTKDFMRSVIVLDSSHVKMKNVSGKKKRQLSAKEKRKLNIYDLTKEVGKYEDYLPLNALWLEYFEGVLRGIKNSARKDFEQSEMATRLLKADFHGCIMTVSRSKCPSYVGTTGILLQETRNVLRIITKDGLKTIPKMNSVFTFEVDGTVFTIYGNHFRLKSSERAVKRFKSKSSLDL